MGEQPRVPVPIGEMARVLGGGMVPGSAVLVGGDPGVGKSTLLLQFCGAMAPSLERVLYVSGEESLQQVRLRAARLGMDHPGVLLLAETDLEAIQGEIERTAARVVVIDSIQTVAAAELSAAPGSLPQVRDCALRLIQQAKSGECALFLIGHVTKEGNLAGPKTLEHMVDAVLYLEGERFQAYRLLRATKNRYGPTNEVGVFEMAGDGLQEVANPSLAFLERRGTGPGSVAVATLEGTRPLLTEVQGLTNPNRYGMPRRSANGVDFNRLLMLIAVLGQRAGVALGDADVYVNVVGGLRIEEPAADLAIALALASSQRHVALPGDLVVVGEVGLSGEVRPVPQLDRRLAEAARLGFRRALVPDSGRGSHTSRPPAGAEGLAVTTVSDLRQAIAAAGLGRRARPEPEEAEPTGEGDLTSP